MAVRRIALALLSAGVLLSACGTAVPSARPASPGPTRAAAPIELQVVKGKLPPGRYVSSGFEQPITFTLDGTWTSTMQQRGYFDLMADPGGAILQVGLVNGVDGAADVHGVPSSAAEAAGRVAANNAGHVIDSGGTAIGGLDGAEATVEWPGAPDALPIYGVWGVLAVPPGAIVLGPGRRVRVAFFERRQGLIAIITQARIVDWDAAVARVAPVLASFTFEP